MTTFQAIVLSVINSFAEFLPISASAHHILVPYLLDWPMPSGAFAGALALGTLLSLLLYFIHDWASILSSFIQMILFRKKPMTLDERLPLFIFVATVPAAIAWYYLGWIMEKFADNPGLTAASLAAFGALLWFANSFSRKNKGMFDWNWLDSLLIGLGQAAMVVPGFDRLTGALSIGLLRNYNREAAAKFTFFAAAPLLAASAFKNLHELNLHSPSPMPDMTWLTFAVTIIVSALAGLLAIGGFMKQIQKKGFGQYIFYRCLLAAGTGIVLWLRAIHVIG
jgi:undecaprenyl-diphosphatase